MRLLILPGADGPDRVALSRELRRRLERVLRLAPGAPVEVVDPDAGVRLETALEDGHLRVLARHPLGPDPHPDLRLYLAPPRRQAGEWAVLRAFEAGLAEAVPLRTRRGERGKGERRRLRWHEQAVAACEQSGRRHLPRVGAPVDLAGALEEAGTEGRRVLLLDPGGAPFPATLEAPLALLVGPEGGFAPEELELARGAGVEPVRLAGHLLRVETAAVLGVGLALDRLGWFSGD